MSENNASVVWRAACDHLGKLLHPDVYSRWIEVIEAGTLEGQTLTLLVSNNFYQTWLEENYLSLIRSAVASVSGESYDIAFEISKRTPGPVKADTQPVEPKPVPGRRPSPVRQLGGPVFNPRFTFDDFVVGPSNNFGHAAALAVAQSPARAYNPLFIYGGSGLGKTHLMQAVGHHVLKNSNAKIAYLSSESFTNEYIEGLQNKSLVQFRKKYRGMDLLLIDDIHFLAGKERMQEEFFHTFNALFDAHKQIVLTSDRPASEIQGLEQRLVTRFEWGLVTELQPPDLETRIAILRNKQAQGGYKHSDEIILFIAKTIRSNIRRLEGALIRATSYASLMNRALTIHDLETLLRDTIDQEKQEDLSFEIIMKTVAEHYDIRLVDMTSKRRPAAITMPRQVAMYLCRSLTPSSLPEIAGAFGKTHATILHACRGVAKKMETDPDLRQSVSHLSRLLEKKS
ncbi:MAG: chromosomal replication initiator protein DnaA [bacterium]